MVNSGGDPIAWVTLLDAQAIQFDVAPPLKRLEKAAGRNPLVTADINAVLVQPSVSTAAVAQQVERSKHLSAVTEQQEEDYVTVFIISKMQKQIGIFLIIQIVVSTVIIAPIVYTLTMDKMRSIATLKLVGAPDRTIIGLIVQQALVLHRRLRSGHDTDRLRATGRNRWRDPRRDDLRPLQPHLPPARWSPPVDIK
jgi:putative ABC transport system permease protein